MDSSSDRRCKRNVGPKWRCSEAASPGESFCEKHLAHRRDHSQKLRINKNKGEEMDKYGNLTFRKRESATISSGPERESSDHEFNRKSVRNRELRLSASSKRKKVIDGKSVNNSVKSVLKVNSGEDCSSGEERGRNCTSPAKSSVVTVCLTEILLI